MSRSSIFNAARYHANSAAIFESSLFSLAVRRVMNGPRTLARQFGVEFMQQRRNWRDTMPLITTTHGGDFKLNVLHAAAPTGR